MVIRLRYNDRKILPAPVSLIVKHIWLIMEWKKIASVFSLFVVGDTVQNKHSTIIFFDKFYQVFLCLTCSTIHDTVLSPYWHNGISYIWKGFILKWLRSGEPPTSVICIMIRIHGAYPTTDCHWSNIQTDWPSHQCQEIFIRALDTGWVGFGVSVCVIWRPYLLQVCNYRCGWTLWPLGERCGWNLILVIFKLKSRTCTLRISYEVALMWRPQDQTEKSTLGRVMAWGHLATSHYPSQYWPSSMMTYGARPQRVNSLRLSDA